MTGTRTSSSLIYVSMAMLFVVIAIAGFAPTSLGLIDGMLKGEQPAPPLIMHFHAITMSTWLLLLLVQTMLVNLRRAGLHRKLGTASLVLAPCILLSMIGVELLNVGNSVFTTAPSEAAESAEYLKNISDSLLIHGVSFLFFPTFYLWAIVVRKRDGDTHKRLMILATVVLMIPALGRLLSVSQVLPDFGLSVIDARHFYMLVLLAPALIHDLVNHQTLHRSYRIGLSMVGVWIVAAHFLWDSPWWINNAPKILGV